VSRAILIVDDDEGIREVLAESLELEGYRVQVCVNGADALARLRDGARPDLILLDLMMPVMDGWQFRREQLADARLAQIPVVVITAAGTLREQIDARHVLRKPFDLVDLLRVVSEG
jgi:CheY-like chemotaxis protein